MKDGQDSRPLCAADAWTVQRNPRLMSLLRSCLQHLEGRDRVELYHMLQRRHCEPRAPKHASAVLPARTRMGDVDGFAG